MTTAASLSSTKPLALARWAVDASHTSVGFSVRHMMITNVRGELKVASGEVIFDPRRLAESRIAATIDAASIDTREEKRDAHLRSADFFDVESHPTMTFESRAIRRSGATYEVTGDLTIRGTTREVVLSVSDVTSEHTDPWGNVRIGASAKTKIRRSDFGVTWNAALEAGGVLVGDEVTISIEVSLVKQA